MIVVVVVVIVVDFIVCLSLCEEMDMMTEGSGAVFMLVACVWFVYESVW